MADVFLIHGSYGSPDGNWFPWLKSELGKSGCSVHVPTFPTPARQSLENWLHVFKKYEGFVNRDTVFVGHSLGPAFILAVLEGLQRPVKAAFFVAGFVSKLDNPDFDVINRTFVDRDFDWAGIKRNCRKFYLYASDNDPYVPLGKSGELADKLGHGLKIVKNAGHFNEEAGYLQFGMLLRDIEEAIQ
jgi:predicted alpha/beta hydrolase family esterase